jgi:hypothetical protein
LKPAAVYQEEVDAEKARNEEGESHDADATDIEVLMMMIMMIYHRYCQC